MKKAVFGILAFVVLAAGSIFVVGQIRGQKGPDGRHGGGEHMMGMAMRWLDLTDDQKAKVKDITESARKNVEPLTQEMRDNHKNLATLGTDGNFDQAKVEALANEQAGIMSKLIVEREKTKAQIFALLTDEQKAKSVEMRQQFAEKMDGHGERQKRGGPGSEF